MKQPIYIKTVLTFLLAFYSFRGFSADFCENSMKKQNDIVTSRARREIEVIKTKNKKLKEKIERVCSDDPKKKAEDFKREDLKKKEVKQAYEKKKEEKKDLVNKGKVECPTVNGSEDFKNKSFKTHEAKKNINEKGKENDLISSGCCIDVVGSRQQVENSLKITFSGVVNAQSYSKAWQGDEDHELNNINLDKSIGSFNGVKNKIEMPSLFFPRRVGNAGNYSDIIMVSDALLHLRAENINEDLGFLYGADVQFQIKVAEGKGALQGANSAKGNGAHVFLNSKYGDLKFGYQFGPEVLMGIDATKIAVNISEDSNLFRRVNLEGIVNSFPPFYEASYLYTERRFSDKSERLLLQMASAQADKRNFLLTTLPFRIAYYSPSYMGARFGISYSPSYASLFLLEKKDTTSSEINLHEKEETRYIVPNYEHIISAGAEYEYNFRKNNIKIRTSAVGEYGRAKDPLNNKHLYKGLIEYNDNDLVGVNFGVSADYKINYDHSLKFAASFAHLGRSGQPKSIEKLGSDDDEYIKVVDNENADDNARKVKKIEVRDSNSKSAMYLTAGAGYQYHNLYTSLTYYSVSKIGVVEDKLHDFALGVQYALSPECSKNKFVPYASLHYFTTDEQATYKFTKLGGSESIIPPNKGVLFLTGVRFSF